MNHVGRAEGCIHPVQCDTYFLFFLLFFLPLDFVRRSFNDTLDDSGSVSNNTCSTLATAASRASAGVSLSVPVSAQASSAAFTCAGLDALFFGVDSQREKTGPCATTNRVMVPSEFGSVNIALRNPAFSAASSIFPHTLAFFFVSGNAQIISSLMCLTAEAIWTPCSVLARDARA